jgi:hypothetical protein
MSDLLRDLIAELLDTELGELACTGSMAPVEDILGRMKAALAADVRGSPPKDLGESKKNQQNSGPEFGASIVKPPLSPT